MTLVIKESLEELHQNPQLFKKYKKKDFEDYFESLIIEGDVVKLDSFLALPLPPAKVVGVHVWDKKSNCFCFYEAYIALALTHYRTNVFEYFYSQKEFSSSTLLDRMCAQDNLDMIDFILTSYPPKNVSERDNLLNSAMNDGFLEQFRLLCTHDKNPINIYENNYEVFRKACVDNKTDFITIFMIDCNIQLDNKIMEWLNGENANETVFEFPLKLIKLRELNTKLKDNLPDKELSVHKDKKMKI